ncbi:MAG: cytochrome c oxidase subunit II [Rhodanobacteraceae bacterium]
MNGGFHLLLPSASSLSGRIDALWWTMVCLCGAVAIGVFVVMWVFCIRYRKGRRIDRTLSRGTTPIELTWTLVPLAIFMCVFAWSMFLYARERTPPADAQTIYVVAKQWMWKVQHPGGQREINQLHVPLDVPVRLTMTSQDVIHSFYVPAFRVKQDVLPGRYTQLWFEATQPGTFPLFCTQYCGLDHAKMGGRVVVMRSQDYASWLRDNGGNATLAARGAAMFRSLGCSGCHGANASMHAPDLDGVYGRTVHLADGSNVTADDIYIRDSILLPDKQVVAGYAPIMPSFQGQASEDDLLALIAYLKSTHARPAIATERSKNDRH